MQPLFLENARRRILNRIRDPSRGTVLVMPEFMGLGNLLPSLAYAHYRQSTGYRVLLTRTAKGEFWYSRLPRLRDLTCDRESLRLRDHRSGFADTPSLFSDALPRPAVEAFIMSCLEPVRMLAHSPQFAGLSDPYHITVNIRRGDYYSVPENRGLFGFDIPGYIGEALRLAQEQYPVRRIHVVSDDIDWCRERLPWLRDVAPTTLSDPGNPLRDLVQLAASRRIICTNSTFSFWGAHISNALHGDNHSSIWVPRFFWRRTPGEMSEPQDPLWSVVETIPGGWDS